MTPLPVRYVKWWQSKASCSGKSSREDSSGGVMSLARVSSMTSAVLVFSCAWIAGMPAACSAFVVPLSSPSMSRCICRSAQVRGKIYAAGNTPFSFFCLNQESCGPSLRSFGSSGVSHEIFVTRIYINTEQDTFGHCQKQSASNTDSGLMLFVTCYSTSRQGSKWLSWCLII